MVGISAAVLAACSTSSPREQTKAADSTASKTTAGGSGNGVVAMPETWMPPAVDSTPDDPFEVAVYRGLALLTHTRDSLPRFVGGNLNCTSCHLDEGRRANSAPLAGVFARYPRFIDRAAAVVPLEDRVNYCFTRSLAGSKLPNDSREMQDIVAYLSYISRDVPVGGHISGEGMPKMPALVGDSTSGHALFTANCVQCHGADGAGVGPAPALWGPKSFSIGALDGPDGAGGIVHPAQHAVGQARNAQRPAGVRHRELRDGNGSARSAGEGARLAGRQGA